jgi:hypothetical protein
LVVAAAVLVLGLQLRAGPSAVLPGSDELGIKGGPMLQVYALRNHQVFAVPDGTVLSAGDEIRFAVMPAGATYVLIASVDGAGSTTIYFPYNGDRSAEVAPQVRTELPGSIVLDNAKGPERLFALFSRSPIAASDVRPELRKLVAAGASRLREPQVLAIPAAQVSLIFEKAQ